MVDNYVLKFSSGFGFLQSVYKAIKETGVNDTALEVKVRVVTQIAPFFSCCCPGRHLSGLCLGGLACSDLRCHRLPDGLDLPCCQP